VVAAQELELVARQEQEALLHLEQLYLCLQQVVAVEVKWEAMVNQGDLVVEVN
jgi:hypothetical protein